MGENVLFFKWDEMEILNYFVSLFIIIVFIIIIIIIVINIIIVTKGKT